jgi:hypothetical protein
MKKILNLTLPCATALTTRINSLIIVVFYEAEEKEKQKIPIEDMYYEILFFLNEPEHDSPKRGKMTIGQGTSQGTSQGMKQDKK